MTAHLSGSLTPEKLLNVDLAWHGLKMEDWLPERLAQDFCGDIDGRARVAVREWKMENGAYGGDLKLRRMREFLQAGTGEFRRAHENDF